MERTWTRSNSCSCSVDKSGTEGFIRIQRKNKGRLQPPFSGSEFLARPTLQVCELQTVPGRSTSGLLQHNEFPQWPPGVAVLTLQPS